MCCLLLLKNREEIEDLSDCFLKAQYSVNKALSEIQGRLILKWESIWILSGRQASQSILQPDARKNSSVMLKKKVLFSNVQQN